MNILCVSTDHDLPEANMLCQLHGNGHTITVVIEPSSIHIDRFRKAGISVYPKRIAGKLDFSTIKLIRKLIHSKNIDIIQAFSKKALCAANLAATFQSVKIVGYRGIVGNLSRFDPGSWLSFLHPRVNKIACVCRAVEDYMKTVCFDSSIPIAIHKGHDVSWYQDLPTGDLGEFGIPDGVPVLCCTANVRPRKGVQVLVDALAKLPQDLNVHLLLIGEANPKALSIPERINKKIHFAGFRRDAVSLVRACDLFVMPSLRREGLPKAVIESMSVGTVPVVTTSGGMPEIVVDGVSGRVIEPGNSDVLAEVISDLLLDEKTRQQLSDKAVERIRSHFNINDTVKAYEKLYSDLASRENG